MRQSEHKVGKVELIIKKRLRWLGHHLRMDDDRLPGQALHWDLDTGRPRKTRNDTICQDLKAMGLTWEEAQQLAHKRNEWHRSVAQRDFDIG